MEATEPTAPGATAAAGVCGEGTSVCACALALALCCGAGPGMLRLPASRLPYHGSRHLPQCHLRARLSVVVDVTTVPNASPFCTVTKHRTLEKSSSLDEVNDDVSAEEICFTVCTMSNPYVEEIHETFATPVLRADRKEDDQ